MNRFLHVLLTLVLLTCAARAAETFTLDGVTNSKPQAKEPGMEKIAAAMQGASASVTQPHVVAELIPEQTIPAAGKPFQIALHLHMDAGWHTYWINPGDAGMATTIAWTLPPGFTAGPIQWPTPEKHSMGPLTTYGYGGDAYLLTTITPPSDQTPGGFEIKAKAQWLVCQEACIPGKGEFTLKLGNSVPYNNEKFFELARQRLPVANTRWNVRASYYSDGFGLLLKEMSPAEKRPAEAIFFPEQENVISSANTQLGPIPGGFGATLDYQQNGTKPGSLSGVVVSDSPLIGAAKSVYLSSFPVAVYKSGPQITTDVVTSDASASQATQAAQPASAGTDNSPGSSPNSSANNATPALQISPAAQTVAAAAASSSGPASGSSSVQNSTSSAPPVEAPFLPFVLAAAFLGGIILNLMPCVLPVLSLKVFSLIRHAGEDPKGAWKQGAAFTAGVVISFWVLAGLLIAFNSAGSHLGWGFQMQSPGFVLALILLFFLLGLNLFGVFEIGTSLVGLDAKASMNADRAHVNGLVSSFGNGALATLAATPCTAPFMGSALGFAAQQPAYIALLVFTALALGMAAPYLLLTIFPGALKFVPKPGEWMVALKQFMGFLLMGTVIFLVYVFIMLVGQDQLIALLGSLLAVSCAAWAYGRWGFTRTVICVLIAALCYFSISGFASPVSLTPAKSVATHDGWETWSPQAVTAALDQGKPVFVDFTAAWCLSCKVNEKVALDTDAVKNAFADKNVVLLRGDWTHSDPQISAALQQYNRAGVPLYLVYSPKAKDTPQVLPEIITPGIVLDALNKL